MYISIYIDFCSPEILGTYDYRTVSCLSCSWEISVLLRFVSPSFRDEVLKRQGRGFKWLVYSRGGVSSFLIPSPFPWSPKEFVTREVYLRTPDCLFTRWCYDSSSVCLVNVSVYNLPHVLEMLKGNQSYRTFSRSYNDRSRFPFFYLSQRKRHY